MPRSSRIDAPGLFQHVIARGVGGCPIFIDDDDRQFFIGKLGYVLSGTSTACYSWVLMGNHFHLLIRTGNHPLGNIMKRLLGGYAIYFNLRHKRSGHLFQNRYKSVVVQEDGYLATLIAYIHLNPLRAGIIKDVKKLSEYTWSGHLGLIGRKSVNWQDTGFVLDFFGNPKAYVNYLVSASASEPPDLDGGSLHRSLVTKRGHEFMPHGEGSFDARILGSTNFAADIIEKLSGASRQPTAQTLDLLLKTVCSRFCVTEQALLGKSRQRDLSRARGVLAAGAKSFGFSGVQIARQLSITEAAVIKAIARGSQEREILVEIRKQIAGGESKVS